MFHALVEWLKRTRESAELAAMDPGERDRVAHDLGVSSTELDYLVCESRDPVQLPQLLAQLRIDEAALRRAQPALLRDMERVCSLCTTTDACNFAIGLEVADTVYPHFCPNAETLKRLPRNVR